MPHTLKTFKPFETSFFMNKQSPVIDISKLVRRYGATEAVNGLSLTVEPGVCYGFFGRNGAGKTTTMKCLLNLLQPTSGSVRVFGLDPARDEVAIKRRLAYVPDNVAFYPWMTVRETLDYLASFREHWNRDTERDLVSRFRLPESQKANTLSRGQRVQLALIAAVCPEPELLLLDEPTSGLDPIVRREFIETVIGAYQESDPGNRTIFVSTHLISEFEGLIDRFTIIDQGKEMLTLDADAARDQFKRIRLRFAAEPPMLDLPEVLRMKREARELELVVRENGKPIMDKLRRLGAESVTSEALALEEIFVATLK